MLNISAEIRHKNRPNLPKRFFQAVEQDDYVADNVSDFKENAGSIRLPILKRGIYLFNEADVYVTLVDVVVVSVQRSCLSHALSYVLKDGTGEITVLHEPKRGTFQTFGSFVSAIQSQKLDVGDSLFAVRLECKLHDGFPQIDEIKRMRPTHLLPDAPREQVLLELFPDYIPID